MEMKKLLILVLFFLLVVSFSSFSKDKFGGWDRWDEELPPWDHDSWEDYDRDNFNLLSIPLTSGTRFYIWRAEKKQWQGVRVNSNLPGSEREINMFCVVSRLSFKSDKQAASVVLFSKLPSLDYWNYRMQDILMEAKVAMVAFPIDSKRIMIRAYERHADHPDKLIFVRKWKIVFKDGKDVLKNEEEQTWFAQRIKNMSPEILLKLIVFGSKERKSFFIGVTVPAISNFLREEELPWIEGNTDVIF